MNNKKSYAQSRIVATLIALALWSFASVSLAATFVSVTIAPPPLPVYAQPLAPGPGYLWTPGYWAYGDSGYYWVPGTWVAPPTVGLLWTPGYWGWRNGFYLWNAGYWGPRVGFYGGVNYGFGYVGVGYAGGYWNNGAFYYNRAVNNVNVTSVHNTYNTVVTNTTVNRVSYNGGTGGVSAEPTEAERAVMKDQHVQPTDSQLQHEHAAAGNRALLASVNHGRPSIAATPQAGAFDHPGVVAARGNAAHNAAHAQGTPGGAHPQTHAQGRPQKPHESGPHHEGEHR